MSSPEPRAVRWRRRAGVTALFSALTAVMTWPQPLVLATHAADHQDVLFNLWRLRWVAHALATSPRHLFDGNIFHPERGVLALSDAMLVQGVLAAPLFWIRLPPLLVHNLLLLGAIVASGVGMFVLAKHLSGSRAGALVAGIVFAYAPYRVEHLMHMELQWAMWIPWAFWALQRTLETRALRHGLLTGVFVTLQTLSCIYYALFLAVLLPLVALLQIAALARQHFAPTIRPLAAGAVIAIAVSALYAVPYSRSAARVGHRHAAEVTAYSAKPLNYLVATETNLLYGGQSGRPERRLFPGFAAPLLALVGVLLLPLSARTIAYIFGGIVAFELSLGMYGMTYPLLYERITLFQGIRAPARAAIFSLFFLGVLAARGCAALESVAKPRVRTAFGLLAMAALLLEYWVAPLTLVRYANEPTPLDAWLARQPPAVVAEFPMPQASRLPGRDPGYAYRSTFHWMRLVNGYSGYYPPSYVQRLDAVEGFPDARALDRLRRDGVTYLIVHRGAYDAAKFILTVETLTRAGFPVVAQFGDGEDEALVFRMP